MLLLFVVIKFLLQYYAIHPIYELHRDEFLHLDLGNHLAWGYTTVPPITGWLSYLILLLGKSVFWVKFFPALFGALTVVVVWKMIEALGGNLFALTLGAVSVICSVLLRINILYQPNSLEYLVWTAIFYTMLRYIQEKEAKWLWYTAVLFSVGVLNKYNIAFLLLGLFPAIGISEHRKVFAHKQFYAALAGAFILVLPNLLWQYQHGFPVIGHMRTLSQTQLVHVSRMDFLKEQLLFFSGSIIVLISGIIGLHRYRPFRKFRLFLWTFVFVLLLYVYFRAKSYYAIGLYPMLLAFGSVYLESLFKKRRHHVLQVALLLAPIIALVPLYKVVLPVQTPEQIVQNPKLYEKLGLLKWEDGKNHDLPQDFADMLGWKELGALVDSAFQLVDDKMHTLVHCDNYGEAGAINYYSEQTYVEALTLDADYIYWYPLATMEIRNVILVQGPWDDDPDREKERPLFESVELVGETKTPYARERGTRVYLLKGAKQPISPILQKEIEQKVKGE